MGRSDQRDYARYHEVLNRAVWSSRQAARILLVLLLQHLDGGDGPLIFGIDETLERRRGAKIRARAIYRDPVRSSRSQVVKASGLRWISLMWLGHVPWAGRHWALPVLTVLAPSTRYYQQQGRQHKKLTDWARQMVMQLRRWLPHRPLVLVGDNSYAVLDLLHCCQSLREPVTLIARLRLDAALYAPAPPRQPGQNGRPPLKGPRRPPLKVFLEQTDVTWASAEVAWYDGITRALELTSQTAVWYRSGKPPVLIRWVLIRDPQGSFATQALLCTDPAADPTQILRVRRQRMPQEGMLVQIDGSHHRWLGEDGPQFTLLLAVDDATTAVATAVFRPEEDTRGYFILMQGLIERRGVPTALYSDRHGVFKFSGKPRHIQPPVEATHFSRALVELGIEQIFARSPQAKGRVERAAGTFQDRLVTELRLAGASTIDQANAVLRDFLPRYNTRFAVPADMPEPAYRPWDGNRPLDEILCFKRTRKVARDNTVKYRWHTLQLLPSRERPSYAGVQVEVLEHTDDRLQVRHEGEIIPCRPAPAPTRCTARFPRRSGSQPRNRPHRETPGQSSRQPTPVATPGQPGARSRRRGTGGREPSQ